MPKVKIPLPPPEKLGHGEVQRTKSSDGQNWYYQFWLDKGGCYCTCPGFAYRSTCKHLFPD